MGIDPFKKDLRWDRFLSLDFGLREFAIKSAKDRLAHYRRFVYEKGGLIDVPLTCFFSNSFIG